MFVKQALGYLLAQRVFFFFSAGSSQAPEAMLNVHHWLTYSEYCEVDRDP